MCSECLIKAGRVKREQSIPYKGLPWKGMRSPFQDLKHGLNCHGWNVAKKIEILLPAHRHTFNFHYLEFVFSN